MTEKKKTLFHVGVVVTLYNARGQVLMAKRAAHKSHAAGVWENISGAVELGEQPVEALAREIREELGDQVEYRVEEIYNTFYTKLENGRELIGISFLARYLDGEIELNDEHTEYRWVSLIRAIGMTKTRGLKEELRALKSKHPEKFG